MFHGFVIFFALFNRKVNHIQGTLINVLVQREELQNFLHFWSTMDYSSKGASDRWLAEHEAGEEGI